MIGRGVLIAHRRLLRLWQFHRPPGSCFQISKLLPEHYVAASAPGDQNNQAKPSLELLDNWLAQRGLNP